jgi:hypothetical protein
MDKRTRRCKLCYYPKHNANCPALCPIHIRTVGGK